MKSLFLLLIPVFAFSQNKFSNNLYADVDIHLASSFKKIIADAIQPENNVEYLLSVGGSAVVGYQPINRFGIGGGFKYSYLGADAGTAFFLVQPKVFFGEGEEGSFIYFNFGQGFNKNIVRDARLYGIGISDIFSAGKRHGFFYGVFLENQRLDLGAGKESYFLFGGKIGVTLNTKKFE